MILKEVQASMATYGCVAAKAPGGAEWVRGWDDNKKGQLQEAGGAAPSSETK